MNIKDFEPPKIPSDWASALPLIFGRQAELMAKYKDIEQLPNAPVSLHHASGQRVIKDFAWRTTEELTESAEAWKKHDERADAEMHALEELADAFHFFVELLIFAGISAPMCLEFAGEEFPTKKTGSTCTYWQPVYKLGLAMNFLRNKSWKVSQVPTDELRFRQALLETYKSMLYVWTDLGYCWEDLFTYYFRKSEVNKFRQRSQY